MASGVSLSVGAGDISILLAGQPTTPITITSAYIGGKGNYRNNATEGLIFSYQHEAINIKSDVDGCPCH